MFGNAMMGPLASSQPNVQGGLLGQGFFQRQQQPGGFFDQSQGLLGNPWFNVGVNLLAAGQDSRINPYTAGLQGMQQAQQYRDSRTDREEEKKRREAELEYRKRMMDMQLQRLTGPTANVRDFEFYNTLSPEQQQIWNRVNARQQNVPSAVQVNNEINRLTAEGDVEGAQRLASLHRASQQVKTGGGGINAYNPAAPTQVTPLVTAEDATALNAAEAAAQAQQSVLGNAQGQAQVKLSNYGETGQRALDTVRSLLNHPGLDKAVGVGHLNPQKMIPGTEAADFMNLHNQSKSQAFLQAFEALKGGGTVTEVEGQKAEASLNRMNTATSVQEYRAAAKDFEDAIIKGFAKLEKQAAGDFSSPSLQGASPEYLEKRKVLLGE